VAVDRRARSPLVAVFLTVFIDLVGFGIVIPLLPIYSETYGADERTLGLLMGSFSAMQLLFSPFWGKLSDRIGRRRVLLGGLIGTAVSYVAFAHASSLAALFVSRMLAGFFGANVATAQAYVADVTTPEDRARGMGLIGAAFGLGFTLGPWLGGELAGVDVRLPGYAAAALSAAAALYGAGRLREAPRTASARLETPGFGALREAFSDRRARLLYGLSLLSILAFSGFESMFTRFGLASFPEAYGLDVASAAAPTEAQLRGAAVLAGRYFAFIGVVSALVQGGLIRRLVPRFGETRLIVVGPAVLAVAFLLVAAAPHVSADPDVGWRLVLLGCVVMPFGFGLNNPALAGLISRAAPPDRQGARLGVSQSMGSLGRMLGPPALGTLFHVAGPSAPFLAAAGTLFAASAIAVFFRRRYGAEFARRDDHG